MKRAGRPLQVLFGVAVDRGRVAAGADGHHRAALEDPSKTDLRSADFVRIGDGLQLRRVRLAICAAASQKGQRGLPQSRGSLQQERIVPKPSYVMPSLMQ